MGQKEKLIKKLKSRPKDFTFEEAETLLRHLTYNRLIIQKYGLDRDSCSVQYRRI